MIRTKIPFLDTVVTLIVVIVVFIFARKLTNGNLIIPITVVVLILFLAVRAADEPKKVKTHTLNHESEGGVRRIQSSHTPRTITLLFKVALVSEAERESITGDLIEEFDQHPSRVTATFWLYKQVFKSLLPLIFKNLKSRRPPSPPIAERGTFSDRAPRQMVKVNLICASCGKPISELPFEPRNPDYVMCRDCHRERRNHIGLRRARY